MLHLIVPIAAMVAVATMAGATRAQQAPPPDPAAAEASAAPAAPTGPTAPGGKMYRWVDRNNTVHYSDRPQPGAEAVAVEAPQTYSAPPRPVVQAPATPAAAETRAMPPAGPACEITAPIPEQVFPNIESLEISYRGPQGGTAELQLSGTLNETRSTSAGQPFTITPVPRGTYTARVSISGAPGVAPCVTAPVTFHVRQASLLSPVRQQMNRRQ